MTKKKKIIEIETQIDEEPDNIPDIDGDEEEEDDEPEAEESDKEECEKSVHVNTPYVSVAVTTHSKSDTLDDVMKKAEHILDKYKSHHIGVDKSNDYR